MLTRNSWGVWRIIKNWMRRQKNCCFSRELKWRGATATDHCAMASSFIELSAIELVLYSRVYGSRTRTRARTWGQRTRTRTRTCAKFTFADEVLYNIIQGGAIKTGPPSHCKYSEMPWPNCVEIGELLQYYMLNTVINILFKNFIALWRYLAKTQLLSFIHIVQIDLSIAL